MSDLEESAKAFQVAKRDRAAFARQTAALSLSCGVDLEAALRLDGEQRERVARRLRRAIERERLRGWRAHPAYSLNRHIALKQGLDALAGRAARPQENGAPKAPYSLSRRK